MLLGRHDSNFLKCLFSQVGVGEVGMRGEERRRGGWEGDGREEWTEAEEDLDIFLS